jgi:hypothetical protein
MNNKFCKNVLKIAIGFLISFVIFLIFLSVYAFIARDV